MPKMQIHFFVLHSHRFFVFALDGRFVEISVGASIQSSSQTKFAMRERRPVATMQCDVG